LGKSDKANEGWTSVTVTIGRLGDRYLGVKKRKEKKKIQKRSERKKS